MMTAIRLRTGRSPAVRLAPKVQCLKAHRTNARLAPRADTRILPHLIVSSAQPASILLEVRVRALLAPAGSTRLSTARVTACLVHSTNARSGERERGASALSDLCPSLAILTFPMPRRALADQG